jgi:hypothetical protein
MNEPRMYATATLLTDGTVLVAGGLVIKGDGWVGLASAERFDPKTNSFTPVGSMAQKRAYHRAVRLQDGRVLVLGGSSASAARDHLASAELFDPSTGKFTSAGKMLQGRVSATADLLPDGKVLIAGGWSSTPFGPLATAELFDPTTGTFQKTGSMAARIYNHASAALRDGRVVIVGGNSQYDESLGGVHIYDPATGSFTAQGKLVEHRGEPTAVPLPDGRVLVLGGGYADSGGNFIGFRRSVEIYDPATGQSTIADRFDEPRAAPAAVTLADGRILLAGGLRGNSDVTDIRSRADLFDPTTGKIVPTVRMKEPRGVPSGVLLPDGRALVLGGQGGTGAILATAEVYVP